LPLDRTPRPRRDDTVPAPPGPGPSPGSGLLRKGPAVLPVLVLLLTVPLIAETVRIANQYAAVDFDTVSGRFMIRTVAGDPEIPSDDHQALTGDFLNSSAVIKLDNQYYRFGDLSGQVTASSSRADTAVFVWTLKGMEITQEIRLTNSIYSPVASFVKIRYWLRNRDTTYHYAGLRFILDTMLGPNDDAAILAPQTGAIGREAEFSFTSVPDHWAAWDSMATPSARLLMSFAERNVVKPDYLTFASRRRLSETKWDFKPDPAKDFRSSLMEPPDTAVSMKWESIPFKPGYANGVAFLFGIAKADANDRMPPLDLVGQAPVRTDAASFWVLAEAGNSDALKSVKGLKVRIELPQGLSLSRDAAEQSFPELKPGERRAVYWNVAVKQKGRHTVKVTAVGNAGSPVVNQVSLPVTCD
jgi:hypothetical protein